MEVGKKVYWSRADEAGFKKLTAKAAAMPEYEREIYLRDLRTGRIKMPMFEFTGTVLSIGFQPHIPPAKDGIHSHPVAEGWRVLVLCDQTDKVVTFKPEELTWVEPATVRTTCGACGGPLGSPHTCTGEP